VAAVVVASLQAVAAAGEGDDLATVEVCSDDTAAAAAAFLRATVHLHSQSRIRLRFRCAVAPATSAGPARASFIAEEAGIAMQLQSPGEEQGTRGIPWLRDVHRPLEKTLALGKAAALELLLESLTADLDTVRLRPLPMPPSPSRSAPAGPRSLVEAPLTLPSEAARSSVAESPVLRTPERIAGPRGTTESSPARTETSASEKPRAVASPPVEAAATAASMPARAGEADAGRAAEPASAPVRTAVPPPAPPPAAAAASAKRNASPTHTALEIALPLAGIMWMPPATVAPELEVGLAWGGPRWWAIADLGLELDSNFAIESRDFHTAGYAIRLGLRRTLVHTRRFRWDADVTVVGHLSQYRRDDLPGAQTHQWSDLGGGAHSRAALRVANHVSALLSLGADAFPTARLASIPGGPNRRVNSVTLDVVVGLVFDF
jgi:hypothetical protein